LNIPPDRQFSTYAGWFVDYAAPTYLIASDSLIGDLARQLRAIGVDRIPGYFPSQQVDVSQALPTIEAQTAAQRLESGRALLLDVRSRSEYDSQHIEGARHIFYGNLVEHIDALLP